MYAARTIQIGELSRRTACNIETIRYYERIGLIPAPQRRGRYRAYDEADVARIAFVRKARELGFTLDDIRQLIMLGESGRTSCIEVRSVAECHLVEVRQKIGNLQRMERVLADCIRACDANEDPSCPLLQALGAP